MNIKKHISTIKKNAKENPDVVVAYTIVLAFGLQMFYLGGNHQYKKNEKVRGFASWLVQNVRSVPDGEKLYIWAEGQMFHMDYTSKD